MGVTKCSFQYKLQFRLLKLRCGVSHASIPRLTHQYVKYSCNVVTALYELLLGKIERNEIDAQDIGLEQSLLQKVAKYRQGTVLDSAKTYCVAKNDEYRQEIQAAIEKHSVAREVEAARARRGCDRQPTTQGRTRPNLVNRRVLVPGTWFQQPPQPTVVYAGVVKRWEAYESTDGEERMGYLIHFDDGDKYHLTEDDTHKYVDNTFGKLAVAEATADGFDDNRYDAITELEVQEEDGSWTRGTIYRHNDGGVCVLFGGSDYEGLPAAYTYNNQVLRDDDGAEISTRPVQTARPHKLVTPILIEDHESDLYYGRGIGPKEFEDQ